MDFRVEVHQTDDLLTVAYSAAVLTTFNIASMVSQNGIFTMEMNNTMYFDQSPGTPWPFFRYCRRGNGVCPAFREV